MSTTNDASGSVGRNSFDIVSTYKSLLASDPDLTMPIAAIESLVQALYSSPSTTISETLNLLQTSSELLRRSIRNPISLSAGTDLFQRYLITSLQRPGQVGPTGDFNLIRQHVLTNGRLFVQRAKQAREKVASFGGELIADGSTVLTYGGSRVVSAMLRQAAEEGGSKSGGSGRHQGTVRFKVIYVLPSTHASPEGLDTVHALRQLGVPVATIPEAAVAYSLGKADTVMVGAEGVVENGGIISRIGTYQIALLAKAMKKPFYVVAESYKFVRLYPLGQYDLPVEQEIVDFKTAEAEKVENGDLQNANADGVKFNGALEEKEGYFEQKPISTLEDAVDFTPPHLISALITENGVLTPSAVSEELIKLWF
ncbi:MAG: hypothetical protein Q9227_004509 [Pyrenula ochraceoflavens]